MIIEIINEIRSKETMCNSKVFAIAIIIATSFATEKIMANEASDIRKFGLEFLHNKQDENGNTFWHRLAQESKNFDDWSQVTEKEKIFRENNGNWLPNPFIENKEGNTARKEVKSVVKKTGNPVSALLVIYFSKLEEGYAGKVALKENRELMAVAQKCPHPNK
jgi:hypothetical protein